MSLQISGETLYQWRRSAIQLAQSNSVNPDEVDWLLQGVTPLNKLSLQLGSYRQQTHISCKFSIAQLTEKWRLRTEDSVPVQYLSGETPWRDLSISVSPDVLIPRPETELIIDIAEDLVAQNPTRDQLTAGLWADLGTGSGAIALALATTFPKASIHAVDISPQALKVAQSNAQRNTLTRHITFHHGNWLDPLISFKGNLSTIISNPPYIPTSLLPTLQREVTEHEPHLALDGGSDGLICLKAILCQGTSYLRPNGIFLTELMYDQSETVAALLRQNGSYTHIKIHTDLSGHTRFVSARKAPSY